jgi:hypothetical protein
MFINSKGAKEMKKKEAEDKKAAAAARKSDSLAKKQEKMVSYAKAKASTAAAKAETLRNKLAEVMKAAAVVPEAAHLHKKNQRDARDRSYQFPPLSHVGPRFFAGQISFCSHPHGVVNSSTNSTISSTSSGYTVIPSFTIAVRTASHYPNTMIS